MIRPPRFHDRRREERHRRRSGPFAEGWITPGGAATVRGRRWPVLPGSARRDNYLINTFTRIADDKWYSRLTTAAKVNYRDMGLVQISICVYKGVSGELNINM